MDVRNDIVCGGSLVNVIFLVSLCNPERLDRRDVIDWMVSACVVGRLDIATWLHNTYNLTRKELTHGNVLMYACSNNDLDMAQWLHKTFGFDKEDATEGNNYAMKKAIERGHNHIIRWLGDTFGLTPDNMVEPVYTDTWLTLAKACADAIKRIQQQQREDDLD